MEVIWSATATIKNHYHYNASINYREDFGVWDCWVHNNKTNKYEMECTYVGCTMFDIVNIINKWFEDHIKCDEVDISDQLTTNNERCALESVDWYLSNECINQNEEVWNYKSDSGEIGQIIIDRYNGITFIKGAKNAVKCALNILNRLYE